MKRLLCSLLCALSGTGHADALKIHASPAVAQAIASVANPLRDEGVELKIVNEGGSTAAIYAVGARAADVALTTRKLNASDRAAAPDRRFEEFQIGVQVVAVIVPRDVWESGVRSLTRAQLLRIYEGEITNWKEVGGEDRKIRFYNSDRGRGIWEIFVQWLYGDPR
ncbi:MAG: transporter binding lipoprotein, partial [Chthoniobacter sp.]|nr:transporter binding lipoprotein [Chthoniobacter sp.]